MKTTTRMDGCVQIKYEARRYPKLFVPFDQNAGCRMPTEEVERWLHQHSIAWWVANYSFMCVSFNTPDEAVLFKLTFA